LAPEKGGDPHSGEDLQVATATWLYVSLLFGFYGFVVAVAAERFVDVGLSEDHKLVTLGKSV
jgi:hypothetical protein